MTITMTSITTISHAAARGEEPASAMTAAVIGLGYVGLPLAQAALESGLQVMGLDVNRSIVDGLREGTSHIDDLSDGDVRGMLDAGFVASTDPSILSEVDIAVICVPTPLSEDGGPDLRAVISVSKMIGENIHPGMTVILESTTYPGTTDDVVRPILEASGLRAGSDFHLAFSPERIDPGNPTFGATNTPKVVGGLTPDCTQSACEFYGRFVEATVPVKGTREAEMTKLLENTYRHINIALVNEMAKFCHELGIDLWDVIAAAKTKPFGFQAFYPGPGVGGHCIPIDPNYLSHTVKAQLGYPFRFVELAEEINSSMPNYVVSRVQDLLNENGKALKGSKVLLLGVTYKPNISDQRESPAVPLARILSKKGAVVSYSDPFVDTWRAVPDSITRASEAVAAARECDIVILLQDHDGFDLPAISLCGTPILDTRGVVNGTGIERL